jgi:hypothetical protein
MSVRQETDECGVNTRVKLPLRAGSPIRVDPLTAGGAACIGIVAHDSDELCGCICGNPEAAHKVLQFFNKIENVGADEEDARTRIACHIGGKDRGKTKDQVVVS